MKRIILMSTVSMLTIFMMSSCASKSKKEKATTISTSTSISKDEANYSGGFASPGRAFPDKLRNISVGITVSHFPNPTYAVLEDSMYIWKHNTIVQSNEDIQIVEFGSFVYTSKGWYLRITMTAEEFATTYNCKNGLLKKGVSYIDNSSWRRDKKLTGGDAMWYYIGKNNKGELVKGTGPIETEGKLIDSKTKSAKIISSNINWTGYGEIGNYSLSGTVPLKTGTIEMNADSIASANLEINLAELNSDNEQLKEHLQGADFFDVNKYPSSTFVSSAITYSDAKNATISGNLTIKGKTNTIKFPIKIVETKDGKSITGKIVVDRTKFGIKYNSKSFFSDLGDQAIKNNFDLEFRLLIK